MKHNISTPLATLAGAALTLGVAAAPATAAGAQHTYYPQQYDATEHFDAGEGPCVPWPGSFHEVRDGGFKVVAAPGGQVPGEVHITGTIAGVVELTPDDPSLPTYRGTYRETVSAVAISFDEQGDLLRVGQYRLRTVLRGTDGSSLLLTLSGKTTVNGTGQTVVQRDQFSCS